MKNELKKGALRQYVLRNFGKSAFTKDGTIRKSILERLKNSKSAITRKRATFALNMRRRGK